MTDPVPSKDVFPQAMPASDSPVTQQEIVSAINYHARELARLTAAWPAPEPAAEWQPIETAPKDGTPILGLVMAPRMQASLEGPRVVKWAGEYGMWSMPGISGLTCSHWMPLQKAPSQPPRDGQ